MNEQPTEAPQPQPIAQPATDIDYSKPVAYDTEGRPLYLRPPEADATGDQPPQSVAKTWVPEPHGNHQYVHVSRAVNPSQPEIPPEIAQRCQDSRRRYPNLNLSDGEYIISAVRRHAVGLFQIWFIAILLVVVFGGLLLGFLLDGGSSQDSVAIGAAGLCLVAVLVGLGAVVSSYVYNGNRFYLTNESVIQEIQTSLFSRNEQTVSLSNIEDASYRQDGIVPQMLNYGTIRLSTEGDETTYRFSYVSNPKQQIATLNNAVEAFKNGRPVEG